MAERELILLALDDSKILRRMEGALLGAGYAVTALADQNELKQVLQGRAPALLLIGEIFSKKNGLEVAASASRDLPTLPVLILAKKESSHTDNTFFEAGLQGYLYPPLRTKVLLSAVETALARGRAQGIWIRREVERKTRSLEERTSKLEREKTRLESILSQIEDGLIVLDETRKILLANQAAQKAFGLKQVDYIGKPVEEVFFNPDLLAMLGKSDESNVKDYEVNFEDGRTFIAEYTRVPNIGSAITMQDITYLKHLDQTKNDLVQTVSHDLRSPLTAVLGYAELVERVGPLNEQQQEFLHRIQGSVRNITSLVNDLLDLGRLEGGMDTQRENVKIDQILKSSLAFLEPLIRKKNLQLQQEIAADVPLLRANPIRIRQLLDNLIGNAIKYSPEGGEIHIRLMSTDDQIILQVADNGPGIPLEDQARIFEKFYRASNVSKVDRGSGLGLAIVKTIVDSYLGRVWVDSALNQGASFFVVLPAYPKPENI
jgi:PAS domain S-box-containing protein